MITALQEKKLDIEFSVFDEDRNGQLEHADYTNLARKFLSVYNISPKSRRGRAVISAYEALWQRHRKECDINDDGRISRSEYRKAVENHVLRENGFNDVHLPLIKAIFNLVDCVEKGVLNRVEFAKLMSVFGVPEADSLVTFTDLDVDSNDRLSQDEIVRAFRQFYLSTNPQAPENRLFGWAY